MARRLKDLNQYPQEFYDIIRRTGVAGERLAVPLDSQAQGPRLIGLWYNFIGNIRARAEVAGADPDIVELAKLSNRVTLEQQGMRLVWANRDESWQAKALKGLQSLPPEPPQAETNADLRRLIDAQRAADAATKEKQ